MISQKCLIDDIKKITIKILGTRGVGRTCFSNTLEEYKKLVIEVIEKQPKFYIPDNNKPLSFEEIGNCKWIYDNTEKEYVQVESYDSWHDCYWIFRVNDTYGERVFKDDFDTKRYYRWEVIEDA